MELLKTTVKTNLISNGERVKKRMRVDFRSSRISSLSTNGETEVIEAFERKHGVNAQKPRMVND